MVIYFLTEQLRNQLLQALSPAFLSFGGQLTLTVIGPGPKPQRHLDERVLKTRLGAKERDKQMDFSQKNYVSSVVCCALFLLLMFVSSLDVKLGVLSFLFCC